VATPVLPGAERLFAEGLFPAEHVAAGVRKPVRLSSNENPLGMPESARKAVLEALADGNRYPMGRDELVAAVAKKHGVKPANVALGNGSTEILQMVVQSVAGPGARLVIGDPTFEHMEAYAAPFAMEVVKVPLRPDHTLDLPAMRKAAQDARGVALVFVCNPNNPTGTIVPCDEVEAWIRNSTEEIVFLVDEAYFDFVEDPGYRTLTHLTAAPNVIVSRTFSKIYGLAGLRIGYGIALEETAKRLGGFAANTNINQLGIAAARACIDDHAYMKRSLEVNRQSKEIAKKTLAELDIEALPSQTNFLMHRIPGPVREHIRRMAEAGVTIGRPFPPMLEWSRVSCGTPEEMGVWAQAIRDFRKKGWV
jgi:histidinol-phosphate aminotransferase